MINTFFSRTACGLLLGMGLISSSLAVPSVTVSSNTGKAVAGLNSVALKAVATASTGVTVTKVEFYREMGAADLLLHSDTNGGNGYQYVAWNLPSGTYIYYAKAFDSTGNSTSIPITVTVLSTPNRNAVGDTVDINTICAFAYDRTPVGAAVKKCRTVSSADFASLASSGANPGDVIKLQGTGNIAMPSVTFSRSGTDNDPIVYVPAGTSVFTSGGKFTIKGKNIVISGFTFSGFNTGTSVIVFDRSTASNADKFQRGRLSGNTFKNMGAGTSSGNIIRLLHDTRSNRLDHNIMENNRSFGMALNLRMPIGPSDLERTTYKNGLTTATNPVDEYTNVSIGNRFDHNTFKTSAGTPIPLQIGSDPDHLVFKTDSLIDNNQFLDLAQGINSKSTGETYLYNSFINVNDAGIGLRVGDSKRIDGNLFRNVANPVSIVGQGHMVVNNIVDNDLGGSIPTDDAFIVHRWGSACTTSACTICNIAAPIPVPSTDANSSANLTSGCTYYGKTANNTIAFNTVRNVNNSAIEFDRAWGGTDLADQQPISSIVKNNILYNLSAGNPNAILIQDVDGGTLSASIDRNLFSGAQHPVIGTNPILDQSPNLAGDFTPNSGSPVLNFGIDMVSVIKDYYFRARKVGTLPDLGAVERQ